MILFTNRRHRLLYIFMAGMEVACLLPFALLLLGYWHRSTQAESFGWDLATFPPVSFAELIATPPLTAFAFLWLILIFYILLADLLNYRLLISPQRELFGLSALVITTLLTVRLILYPDSSWTEWHWLQQSLSALLDFTNGVRPELALILLNLFLWLRVSLMTGRDLSFLSVGRVFRVGILSVILGGLLLTGWVERPTSDTITYLLLFFGCGLASVALARMDDKALIADTSTGALLPWPRLSQLLLTVLGILGLSWLLIPFYTPSNIWTVLGWFSPLWSLLGDILIYPFILILQLIGPWLDRIVAYLRTLMAEPVEQAPAETGPLGVPDGYTEININDILAEQNEIRYGLVFLAVIIGLGLIWLFFLRPPQRQRTEEEEESMAEALEWNGNLLQQGWDRLRQLADLARRYGMGTQLLAAISVQNIYANVGRLAYKRGYPRQRSQPPEAYLPQLLLAFPEHHAAIERITEVYMRVDYGGQQVDSKQLDQLRADFQKIKDEA